VQNYPINLLEATKNLAKKSAKFSVFKPKKAFFYSKICQIFRFWGLVCILIPKNIAAFVAKI